MIDMIFNQGFQISFLLTHILSLFQQMEQIVPRTSWNKVEDVSYKQTSFLQKAHFMLKTDVKYISSSNVCFIYYLSAQIWCHVPRQKDLLQRAHFSLT